MKLFVPPDVAKSAGKSGISDEELCDCIVRAERGLIDARIGAFLIKQRVPRKGSGRSGGFRTIIAYRQGDLAVFLHIFAKNAKGNLTKLEANLFQRLATALTGMDDDTIMRMALDRNWKSIGDESDCSSVQE